jgi:hypothetical protein
VVTDPETVPVTSLLIRTLMDDSSRMSWQPIETAPRTGAIMLCNRAKSRYRIVVGRWTDRFGWQSEPGAWPCHPTHWMPLPEPPPA